MNELKRYSIEAEKAVKFGSNFEIDAREILSESGRYAIYSEAAALLDEKDKEIERLNRELDAEGKAAVREKQRGDVLKSEVKRLTTENRRLLDAIKKSLAVMDGWDDPEVAPDVIYKILRRVVAATAQGGKGE